MIDTLLKQGRSAKNGCDENKDRDRALGVLLFFSFAVFLNHNIKF